MSRREYLIKAVGLVIVLVVGMAMVVLVALGTTG